MSAQDRQMRYCADPDSVAYLSTDLQDTNFENAIAGLIANESYTGCCLVFLAKHSVPSEGPCLLKVGELPTTEANVVWKKEVDENLVSVGFQYTSNECTTPQESSLDSFQSL